MSQLQLFGEAVGTFPYPSPCPERGECPSSRYFMETGYGCSGDVAVCRSGQVSAGRYIPRWQWELMSGYERRCYERKGAIVL